MMNLSTEVDNSTPDARTIHVANLNIENITEEILYELFLQGGPLERVSIPKEKDGSKRSYGFITYKHISSVGYALSVFSGTRLHNRELRLNYRQGNKPNDNSSTPVATRSQAMCPQPLLSLMPPMHQFQMQNTYENSSMNLNQRGTNALSNPMQHSASKNPFTNTMTPKRNVASNNSQAMKQIDVAQLLALSAQMMPSMSSPNNDNSHQSKMMHRQDNRTHNRNPNYSTNDRDQRRNDRKRNRSRERSDWVQNQGNNNNNRNDRNNRNNSRSNEPKRRRY